MSQDNVPQAPRRPKFLSIALGDYAEPGIGGNHSWAYNSFNAFGDEAAYVCTTHDPDLPLGTWSRRTIRGVSHWALPVYRNLKMVGRPIIPGRISDFLSLRRNRDMILDLGPRAALVAAPECLLAISPWPWNSLCYRFPGIENPLEKSRYPFGHYFSRIFDNAVFRALQKADVILASADETAIQQLVSRSHGKLSANRVSMFPTGIQRSLFHPLPRSVARAQLHADPLERILLYCGRLNHVKGWRLVVDAFRVSRSCGFADRLWIAGDGEDRMLLEKLIQDYELSACVDLLGSVPLAKLSTYYSAANLLCCGSVYEGWSQTMLEALSCGMPIVSTLVSGAQHLVQEGRNGYIVRSRDEREFAAAIHKALQLEHPELCSIPLAEPYDLKNLQRRLYELWNPLQRHDSDDSLTEPGFLNMLY